MMFAASYRWTQGVLFAVAIALPPLGASAAPPTKAVAKPTIEVTPRARHERDEGSLLPFYRPTWWLEVKAKRGDNPIEKVEYRIDIREPTRRTASGSWPVDEGHRDAFHGNVFIDLNHASDYNNDVSVRVRVADTAGKASPWASFSFPDDAIPMQTKRPKTSAQERVVSVRPKGRVQVTADAATPVGEVKDSLRRKARMLGGNAIDNFHIVGSEGESTIFAADAVFETRVAAPTPRVRAGSPALKLPRLGSITLPERPRP